MKKKETTEAERIETLQAQIQEVGMEIAQKTHYQRQLEHMIQRLQRNQVASMCDVIWFDMSECDVTQYDTIAFVC